MFKVTRKHIEKLFDYVDNRMMLLGINDALCFLGLKKRNKLKFELYKLLSATNSNNSSYMSFEEFVSFLKMMGLYRYWVKMCYVHSRKVGDSFGMKNYSVRYRAYAGHKPTFTMEHWFEHTCGKYFSSVFNDNYLLWKNIFKLLSMRSKAMDITSLLNWRKLFLDSEKMTKLKIYYMLRS